MTKEEQSTTGHRFSSDEAREAGRKGGERVSRDRAHMAAIGRRGGQRRGENMAKKAAAPKSETSAP